MRKSGGTDTGTSPVDRRKTGRKDHLICNGRGTPLTVITTAANVNDVTQTLTLVAGIPPVAGGPRPSPAATYRSPARRTGRRLQPQPRRTPQTPDRARNRPQRRPEKQGLGKLRYVVE
ncbi:transposase [Streptomyces sp. NPDC005529]|uniref:transposase n=1 Tax=unclassified Streptomyces TaxID=2593676 RepID=UPI0033A19A88